MHAWVTGDTAGSPGTFVRCLLTLRTITRVLGITHLKVVWLLNVIIGFHSFSLFFIDIVLFFFNASFRCSFFVRDSQPARLAEKARPRCVPGICSLHFRKLQEILKGFKKSSCKKVDIFKSKIEFENIFEHFPKIFKKFQIKIFVTDFRSKIIHFLIYNFFLNRFRNFWRIQKWRLEVPSRQRGRVSERNVALPPSVISCRDL